MIDAMRPAIALGLFVSMAITVNVFVFFAWTVVK
jgi:hypothetical protein